MRALQCLDKALRGWNAALLSVMHPDVKAVASSKHPATIAAMGILLSWPDIAQ